jgi:two-component system, OmpR family, response regulator RegX3
MTTDDDSRIALLEDDVFVGSMVSAWLKEAGYRVDWFEKGNQCVKALETSRYSACLLDWMVPDLSGPEVMARLQLQRKEFPFPVIFITGRDSEEDMVQMLNAGADDYIVKPVSEKILLARLHSVLRRTGGDHAPSRTKWGNLEADFNAHAIYVNGARVDLTAREAALAFYFLQNIGRLLTRPHLLTMVWHNSAEVDSRKIDVYVSILRRKLGLSPENGWRLVSIYGHGYRLEWSNGRARQSLGSESLI